MYQANNWTDAKLIYSILHQDHPQTQIQVDSQGEKYHLYLTETPFVSHPKVPVKATFKVIYGDTDSVFVSVNYNTDDYEFNRKTTFELATLCGKIITEKVFNRKPIELEFEKIYQPFILLTKKRYIGRKYTDATCPMNLSGITMSGIAVTRRDYCHLVKKCYKKVVDTIVNGEDPSVAKDIYLSYIDKIRKYNVSHSDLVISAQIARDYTCKHCKQKVSWVLQCQKCKTGNPQGSPECKKCKVKPECLHAFSLAHIHLAQLMLYRNCEIQIGDRIQYIFKESDTPGAQKCTLAEDLNFAKEHNLKFNRSCYLEQLAKPLVAFFKVVFSFDESNLKQVMNATTSAFAEFGGTGKII